jgi:hypothetical protein
MVMKVEWKSPNSPAPSSQVYFMASLYEVRTLLDSIRMLKQTPRAWRQVKRSPGACCAGLVSYPLRRAFYVYSGWEDREALFTFAGTEPHLSVVRDMLKLNGITTQAFWYAPASTLPLTWPEARRRTEEGERRPAAPFDEVLRHIEENRGRPVAEPAGDADVVAHGTASDPEDLS